MKIIRFGIIGASNIAQKAIAPAIAEIPQIKLSAVSSRSLDKAKTLAHTYGADAILGYENLLKRDDIDAVYVSLPPKLTEEWAYRSLEANKHVLAEKPSALSLRMASTLVALAKIRGRIFMEGYMFQFHPQQRKVMEIISRGRIGRPIQFEANFGIPKLPEDNFRNRPELGGGATNDLAGYPLLACGLTFGMDGVENVSFSTANPQEGGAALVQYSSGKRGLVSWGFGLDYRNEYRVWGSDGIVEIGRAFSCPKTHVPLIRISSGKSEAQECLVPADHFVEMIYFFLRAMEDQAASHELFTRFLWLATILDGVRGQGRP